jgi:hypothetical protein
LFVMLAAAVLSSGLSCSGGDAPIPDGTAGAPGTGGSPGAGGAPGAAMIPDPCTLLTPDEWAPLMGMTPVVEPRTGAPGGVTVNGCDWTLRSAGGTKGQSSSLSLAVAGGYSPTPMSMPIAIGDAGYIDMQALARTVNIGWKKGALSAIFHYSALLMPPPGKTWPELLAAATALARQAASRMP